MEENRGICMKENRGICMEKNRGICMERKRLSLVIEIVSELKEIQVEVYEGVGKYIYMSKAIRNVADLIC